jgi:hypothetical protein
VFSQGKAFHSIEDNDETGSCADGQRGDAKDFVAQGEESLLVL